MKKKPNYGQKPLPSVEAQVEANAEQRNEKLGMPTLAQIKSETARLGLTDEDAEQIYDSWCGSGFRLKDGNRIKDWKAVIRTWMRHELFISQKKAALATRALEKREEKRQAALRRMKGGN